MTWTCIPERAERTAAHESSIGNRGTDQIRRMVLAPETERGGETSEGVNTCTALPERTGSLTEFSISAEPEERLVATRSGGTAGLEDCIWQQEWAAIIAKSQSVIIILQQE